jgi:hypothetical protein
MRRSDPETTSLRFSATAISMAPPSTLFPTCPLWNCVLRRAALTMTKTLVQTPPALALCTWGPPATGRVHTTFQAWTWGSEVLDSSAPLTDTQLSMTRCIHFPISLLQRSVLARLALHLHTRQFSLNETSTMSINTLDSGMKSNVREGLQAPSKLRHSLPPSWPPETRSIRWKTVFGIANTQTRTLATAAVASIMTLQPVRVAFSTAQSQRLLRNSVSTGAGFSEVATATTMQRTDRRAPSVS